MCRYSEGVQCATMTHVLKLQRHWRDVGRSDPAGGHFGCTADDAALCYGGVVHVPVETIWNPH